MLGGEYRNRAEGVGVSGGNRRESGGSRREDASGGGDGGGCNSGSVRQGQQQQLQRLRRDFASPSAGCGGRGRKVMQEYRPREGNDIVGSGDGGGVALDKQAETRTMSDEATREEAGRSASSTFRGGDRGSAVTQQRTDDDDPHEGRAGDEGEGLDMKGENTEQQTQQQQHRRNVVRPEESSSFVGSESARSERAENSIDAAENGVADNQGGFSSEASSRSGCSSHSGHHHRQSRTLLHVHPSPHQHLYLGQHPAVEGAEPGVGNMGVGVPGAADGEAGAIAAAATGSRRSNRRRRIARSEPWHFDLSQHRGGDLERERRARRNHRHHSNEKNDGVMPSDGGGGGGGGGEIAELIFNPIQAERAGETGGRTSLRSRLGPRGSR